MQKVTIASKAGKTKGVLPPHPHIAPSDITLPAVTSFPASTTAAEMFHRQPGHTLQTPTRRQRGLAEQPLTEELCVHVPRSPPSFSNLIRCFACYQLAIHRTDPNPAQNCPGITPTALGLSNSVPRALANPAWLTPGRVTQPQCTGGESCPRGPTHRDPARWWVRHWTRIVCAP